MILACHKLWNNSEFEKKNLVIEGGKIKHITKFDETVSDRVITDFLLPGFISIHDHGALGGDANHANIEHLNLWSKLLLREGITSFLPTTSTVRLETLMNSFEVLGEVDQLDGANFIGINAEGPFFSKEHHGKGSHQVENILSVDLELMKKMYSVSNSKIKLMTIAPEIEDADVLLDFCNKNNIKVFIGHTDSENDDIYKFLEAGSSGFTHLFNGMTSFHHRMVGPSGIALIEDNQFVEIIADGTHLSKEAIRLVYKVKPSDKIITVTDSIFAKEMAPGTYYREEKNQNIIINNEGKVLLENGRLAGSTNKMNALLKYQVEEAKIPFEKVILSMTKNPATLLGLEGKKGEISENFDADLVVMNSDYEIVEVYIKGKKEI